MSETPQRSDWPDGPPRVKADSIDLSRPHMIGMQGELMAPLTQLLTLAGFQCTGTDQQMSPDIVQRLRTTVLGITGGEYRTSCAVYSSAIPDDHPDLVTARATGVPLIHRAQALDVLMNEQRGSFEHVKASIGVSGSHGKSCTTAMIGWILRTVGAGPVVMMGGRWADTATGAHAGRGETFVAEIDESDRSHLLTHPDIAVIPALGHEHPETYSSAADVHATMLRWACGLPRDATVILCADDDGTAALAVDLKALPGLRVLTYGTAPGADVPLTGLHHDHAIATGTAHLPGHDPVHIWAAGPGLHQVRNATAAIIAAALRGIDPARAAQALASFPGVQRRLLPAGTGRDVTVVDSYAAHPTEITADLAAARALTGTGRLLVAFQPCGLERLVTFGPQIGRALACGADQILLLPLHTRYPDPTPERAEHACGQLASQLAQATGRPLIPSSSNPRLNAVALAAAAEPGDVILTMGRGDVTGLGTHLLQALRTQGLTRTQPRRRPRRARRRP
ncbi:Mur ligase family protein [Actinocorallia libanotica]|uniref:UDP-N-acetylmuramate--L-alanine ligase n=1 Tax=Actinocorallia libanotica TaxID=46162 RepID=A0ABP4BWD4_9ACTN